MCNFRSYPHCVRGLCPLPPWSTVAKGKAKEHTVVSGERYITIPDTEDEDEDVTIGFTEAKGTSRERPIWVSSDEEGDTHSRPGRRSGRENVRGHDETMDVEETGRDGA
ncbi:MAG: hypothetical protein Q9212_006656 [Teloschistes hypoglaucus]